MLVTEWLHKRLTTGTMALGFVDFTECTAHLYMEDAGRLVVDVIERRLAGYHQYFPALTMQLKGYPLGTWVAEKYPSAVLRRPVEELESLVDIDAITRELGWRPTQRLVVQVG
jgi:hypothetical protein